MPAQAALMMYGTKEVIVFHYLFMENIFQLRYHV